MIDLSKLIPSDLTIEDFNDSPAEYQIYNALKALPDDFVVFHSVRWKSMNRSRYIKNGEADFTIFNPKRGLIVIEAKSGAISLENGIWYQTNQRTLEKKRIDPMAQAERSCYTFSDLIEEAIDKESSLYLPERKYWVQPAIWFTSVSKRDFASVDLPPNYRTEIMLFEEDLHSPEKTILKLFDFYKLRENSQLPSSDKKLIMRLLSPEFSVVPSMGAVVAEEDIYFNRMTSEQSYLLDYLEEQSVAAIQGGAGTGKTMIAVEKARRLRPSGSVLFLCYNRYLVEYLQSTFGQELNHVTFTNLDALVCRYKRTSTSGGEKGIRDFLNSDIPLQWEYTHIIIDEGQDFAEDHISLLSSIAELHHGVFYVFYDKNQLVQQRNSLSWASRLECRLVLSSNCRNTKSIAITSNRAIRINQVKMRREVTGKKPNFHIVNSEDSHSRIVEKIIGDYISNGITENQIVILSVKTEDASLFANVDRIGKYTICGERDKKSVFFTTARKFKGLESDVVILVDVSVSSFEDDEARRVFYVAASRARHFLEIVAFLSREDQIRTAQALTGKRSILPALEIDKELKVKIVMQKDD